MSEGVFIVGQNNNTRAGKTSRRKQICECGFLRASGKTRGSTRQEDQDQARPRLNHQELPEEVGQDWHYDRHAP